MTEAPSPEAKPSERLGRPPRFVVGMVIAVALVVAGWSAVWYAGARKGDEMIAAWLAAEAARGHAYDCAERSVGGYPFRVEVSCASPSVDITDTTPHIHATARAFRAVAQVWDLTHVIFEIDGPVRIAAGDDPAKPHAAGDADWQLLQGSLRAPDGKIASADIAITGLTATTDAATLPPGGGVSVSARHVEAHSRHSGPAKARDYDIAADADDLVVAFAGTTPPEPVDLSFVGRLAALPYPPPRDPAEFLAAWRAAGGSIEVTKLSAAQGETEIRAEGTLVPDDTGRPEGTVTVRLAGPDINTPGAAGAFGGLAPLMALALKLTGKPAEIDGRTALSGQIDLKGGQVFLGPMPLLEVPSLF